MTPPVEDTVNAAGSVWVTKTEPPAPVWILFVVGVDADSVLVKTVDRAGDMVAFGWMPKETLRTGSRRVL